MLPVHHASNGQQDKRRGYVASVQMLIDQEERGARDRQCEHGRDEGYPGPLRAGFPKYAPSDAPACKNDQPYGGQLPQQSGNGKGNVGYTNKTGDAFIEERSFGLKFEEGGILRVKGWIQITFHRGEVDAVVLNAGVIAHDCKAEQGEAYE